MEPIYKTSYLGSNVTVYQNRVEWKMLIQQETIPINQIASIDLGIPLYAAVIIETTGGKKYKIPINPFGGIKKKLQEAIYEGKGMNSDKQNVSQSNNLSDLEQLAQLKEKGIISQEEFEAKKKQILGL